MKIGAADRGQCDFDDGVPWIERDWLRNIVNADVLFPVPAQCLHTIPPPVTKGWMATAPLRFLQGWPTSAQRDAYRKFLAESVAVVEFHAGGSLAGNESADASSTRSRRASASHWSEDIGRPEVCPTVVGNSPASITCFSR